jgi:hypothetical protein
MLSSRKSSATSSERWPSRERRCTVASYLEQLADFEQLLLAGERS